MFIKKNGKGKWEVYDGSKLISDVCTTSGEAEREFLKHRYGDNKRYGF